MNTKIEDVKDAAIKLGDIFKSSPIDFYYLKGYIHCLWQKENSIPAPQDQPQLQPTGT